MLLAFVLLAHSGGLPLGGPRQTGQRGGLHGAGFAGCLLLLVLSGLFALLLRDYSGRKEVLRGPELGPARSQRSWRRLQY
jgi:hypothetical protein